MFHFQGSLTHRFYFSSHHFSGVSYRAQTNDRDLGGMCEAHLCRKNLDTTKHDMIGLGGSLGSLVAPCFDVKCFLNCSGYSYKNMSPECTPRWGQYPGDGSRVICYQHARHNNGNFRWTEARSKSLNISSDVNGLIERPIITNSCP